MPTAIANPLPATMHAQASDRYFTVDGVRLRYRDEGAGPALLLVHGWTLDLEMWNSLAAALRATFRVIRVDRRGFGLSSGQPALQRDIADLDALWCHLALDGAALLGMSQGARAVLGLAACADRNISCLVLDGPPDIARDRVANDVAADSAGDDDVPLTQYRALMRAQGIDAFRRAWATHPLTQLRTADRNASQLLRAIISRYPGNDLLQDAAPGAAGLRQCAAPVRPESIAIPVLVITGAHDLARRIKSADRLAQRFPRAERAVVADAGHLPNLDNPVAYNNLVRAFLERHQART
ncbi:MAG TPA: alpha/beta hydrolase [Steroidobacteraceae bacterium]|nr:alpha/beta hydrolase [Steroidobacteraceae bacterium]